MWIRRTTAILAVSIALLLGTGASTFAKTETAGDVAPAASDALAGNCYLALTTDGLFEMAFGEDGSFEISSCTSPGTYSTGNRFGIFTLWNASCGIAGDPVSFDGVAIVSAVLLFRAEGALETRGLAFRVPCGALP